MPAHHQQQQQQQRVTKPGTRTRTRTPGLITEPFSIDIMSNNNHLPVTSHPPPPSISHPPPSHSHPPLSNPSHPPLSNLSHPPSNPHQQQPHQTNITTTTTTTKNIDINPITTNNNKILAQAHDGERNENGNDSEVEILEVRRKGFFGGDDDDDDDGGVTGKASSLGRGLGKGKGRGRGQARVHEQEQKVTQTQTSQNLGRRGVGRGQVGGGGRGGGSGSAMIVGRGGGSGGGSSGNARGARVELRGGGGGGGQNGNGNEDIQKIAGRGCGRGHVGGTTGMEDKDKEKEKENKEKEKEKKSNKSSSSSSSSRSESPVFDPALSGIDPQLSTTMTTITTTAPVAVAAPIGTGNSSSNTNTLSNQRVRQPFSRSYSTPQNVGGGGGYETTTTTTASSSSSRTPLGVGIFPSRFQSSSSSSLSQSTPAFERSGNQFQAPIGTGSSKKSPPPPPSSSSSSSSRPSTLIVANQVGAGTGSGAGAGAGAALEEDKKPSIHQPIGLYGAGQRRPSSSFNVSHPYPPPNSHHPNQQQQQQQHQQPHQQPHQPHPLSRSFSVPDGNNAANGGGGRTFNNNKPSSSSSSQTLDNQSSNRYPVAVASGAGRRSFSRTNSSKSFMGNNNTNSNNNNNGNNGNGNGGDNNNNPFSPSAAAAAAVGGSPSTTANANSDVNANAAAGSEFKISEKTRDRLIKAGISEDEFRRKFMIAYASASSSSSSSNDNNNYGSGNGQNSGSSPRFGGGGGWNNHEFFNGGAMGGSGSGGVKGKARSDSMNGIHSPQPGWDGRSGSIPSFVGGGGGGGGVQSSTSSSQHTNGITFNNYSQNSNNTTTTISSSSSSNPLLASTSSTNSSGSSESFISAQNHPSASTSQQQQRHYSKPLSGSSQSQSQSQLSAAARQQQQQAQRRRRRSTSNNNNNNNNSNRTTPFMEEIVAKVEKDSFRKKKEKKEEKDKQREMMSGYYERSPETLVAQLENGSQDHHHHHHHHPDGQLMMLGEAAGMGHHHPHHQSHPPPPIMSVGVEYCPGANKPWQEDIIAMNGGGGGVDPSMMTMEDKATSIMFGQQPQPGTGLGPASASGGSSSSFQLPLTTSTTMSSLDASTSSSGSVATMFNGSTAPPLSTSNNPFSIFSQNGPGAMTTTTHRLGGGGGGVGRRRKRNSSSIGKGLMERFMDDPGKTREQVTLEFLGLDDNDDDHASDVSSAYDEEVKMGGEPRWNPDEDLPPAVPDQIFDPDFALADSGDEAANYLRASSEFSYQEDGADSDGEDGARAVTPRGDMLIPNARDLLSSSASSYGHDPISTPSHATTAPYSSPPPGMDDDSSDEEQPEYALPALPPDRAMCHTLEECRRACAKKQTHKWGKQSKDQQISFHSSLPSKIPPKFTYSQLIFEALYHAPEGQLTLSEIYQYVMAKHSFYFELVDSGYPYPDWRNSIRHNLSLNDAFVKAERRRSTVEKGKKGGSPLMGHFWKLDWGVLRSRGGPFDTGMKNKGKRQFLTSSDDVMDGLSRPKKKAKLAKIGGPLGLKKPMAIDSNRSRTRSRSGTVTSRARGSSFAYPPVQNIFSHPAESSKSQDNVASTSTARVLFPDNSRERIKVTQRADSPFETKPTFVETQSALSDSDGEVEPTEPSSSQAVGVVMRTPSPPGGPTTRTFAAGKTVSWQNSSPMRNFKSTPNPYLLFSPDPLSTGPRRLHERQQAGSMGRPFSVWGSSSPLGMQLRSPISSRRSTWTPQFEAEEFNANGIQNNIFGATPTRTPRQRTNGAPNPDSPGNDTFKTPSRISTLGLGVQDKLFNTPEQFKNQYYWDGEDE